MKQIKNQLAGLITVGVTAALVSIIWDRTVKRRVILKTEENENNKETDEVKKEDETKAEVVEEETIVIEVDDTDINVDEAK